MYSTSTTTATPSRRKGRAVCAPMRTCPTTWARTPHPRGRPRHLEQTGTFSVDKLNQLWVPEDQAHIRTNAAWTPYRSSGGEEAEGAGEVSGLASPE
jgi:hypothetical protein